jgi:hypothetical protein
MARNVGMGILRMIAVIGGVTVLIFVVTTTGATLMPGTKVRKLFGTSPEALAGNSENTGAGTPTAGADGGVDAGTPLGGQGGNQGPW